MSSFLGPLLDLGGGLIGGAFGLIGQENQARLQGELMERQHEMNKETMNIQNQYQIDQWNRENAYNDPAAVRSRYEAAGISAQAAFGQGSASGAGIAGSFSSAPSGGAPSGSVGSANTSLSVDPIGAYYRMRDLEMRDELNQANVKKVTEEANMQEFNRTVLGPAEVALKKSQTDLNLSAADLNTVKAELEPLYFSLAQAKSIPEINLLTAQFLKTAREAALTDAQKVLVEKQAKETDQRTKLLVAQRALVKWQSSKAAAECEKIIAETAKIQNEREALSAQSKFAIAQAESLGAKLGIEREKLDLAKRQFKFDKRCKTSAEVRNWIYGFLKIAVDGVDAVNK